MGYPGIKLEHQVDTVHGFLFYSHNLDDNWELDIDTYIYVLKDDKEKLEE